MRGRFIKYMYLGYSKNEFEKYNKEIDLSNLKTLKDICRIYCLMSIIVSIFYYYFDYSYKKISICLFYGIAAGVIFEISKYMYKNIHSINTIMANMLIVFTTFLCYTYGIYLGVFISSNSYSVTIIWMFMLMQTVFNIGPIYNLMSILPSVIIFICCSAIIKDTIFVAYDILHTLIVVTIGFYMSYNKSKLKVDYIIASSELKKRNDKLYNDNIIDYLTGLHNRKFIFERLYEVQDECIMNDESISCIVIDVDNFKLYNDFYGHPAGDDLLNKIGQVFRNIQEDYDIKIGRIGGEEFLALWKGESLEYSKIIANILKDEVMKLNIKHEKSDVRDIVTISQGMYVGSCEKTKKYIDYIYNMADAALYEAKKRGKNCISIVK
ncbi:MAG: GGDEF domain-containing protein [Clostridium sp.]|nr:GGDEF domain-containing protein [Clostridium sp.]